MGENQLEGHLIHSETGFCLTFGDAQMEKSKPKMVLTYLADIVKDLARNIEKAELKKCGSGEGQIWRMESPAQWNKNALNDV